MYNDSVLEREGKKRKGIKKMKGTEKQIKWAEDIKTNAINTLEANIEKTATEPLFKADNQAYRILLAVTKNALSKIEDAGTLIDRRIYFDPRSLIKTASTWADNIRTGRFTVEQIAEQNRVTEW